MNGTKVVTISRFWLALFVVNLIALGMNIALERPLHAVFTIAMAMWTAHESGVLS